MPSGNISNVEKGRRFRDKVCQALSKHYGVEFIKEQTKLIGNPPKEHKFDLVSENNQYVAECKSISWTITGGNPNAKITSCNEAVSDLSYLPSNTKKLLVIRQDMHPRRQETLAQYYKRLHKNRLGEVIVLEFDPKSGRLAEI